MTVAQVKKAGADKKATGPGGQPDHDIRRFHELGRRVLARAAKDDSDAAARVVGADDGISVDRARKAALFASESGHWAGCVTSVSRTARPSR